MLIIHVILATLMLGTLAILICTSIKMWWHMRQLDKVRADLKRLTDKAKAILQERIKMEENKW